MTMPFDTHASEALSTDAAAAVVARPLLACLITVARRNGLSLNADQLAREHGLPARDLTIKELSALARKVGMRARVAKTTWERLIGKDASFPLITRFADGGAVVAVGTHRTDSGIELAVVDPVIDPTAATLVNQAVFSARWKGEVLLAWRVYALTATDQPFSLRWFISELWPERAAFRDVAVTAVLLQVLGLASPLFFQIVFDKVLSHNTFQTLYVLTVGVVAAILLEALFGAIRRYLLLAATNKIDMRLATRTFGHLLSLPIAFFEQMPAGVTVQHMSQVEGVRGFLTGRLLLTALDATSLLVFLPILALYSVPLTLIVLLSTAMMTGIIIAMIKPFGRRLSQYCRAEAERQSMLIETIHGVRTVKSSAIEPVQRRNWDRSVSNAIYLQFQVGKMSLIGQSINQIIEKLLPVAVVGIGSLYVMDHTMTVGALIAFQMLSGRVTAPLVQIVSLVQGYQETVMSVRMLAEVMNQPPERPVGSTGLRPVITGDLEFEKVRFRYRREGPQTLESVSLHIPSGAVVGIVGRSGSGKTTLTRLVQAINLPQEGVIRFDGVDLREIDLHHLRSNIGVVLQDNFLFRGTVRENIAITRPAVSLEEVVAVARMSGADEFIERMPQGYDTRIEEGATNLSGGQRQRLAIARALLTRPRLLILDEATSALDPDSEAIFMDNLNAIVAGRTVLIVSHRLTTLVRCTAIIVMEQGRIVDGGTHAELVKRCPIYQHLWNQQHRQH